MGVIVPIRKGIELSKPKPKSDPWEATRRRMKRKAAHQKACEAGKKEAEGERNFEAYRGILAKFHPTVVVTRTPIVKAGLTRITNALNEAVRRKDLAPITLHDFLYCILEGWDDYIIYLRMHSEQFFRIKNTEYPTLQKMLNGGEFLLLSYFKTYFHPVVD